MAGNVIHELRERHVLSHLRLGVSLWRSSLIHRIWLLVNRIINHGFKSVWVKQKRNKESMTYLCHHLSYLCLYVNMSKSVRAECRVKLVWTLLRRCCFSRLASKALEPKLETFRKTRFLVVFCCKDRGAKGVKPRKKLTDIFFQFSVWISITYICFLDTSFRIVPASRPSKIKV